MGAQIASIIALADDFDSNKLAGVTVLSKPNSSSAAFSQSAARIHSPTCALRFRGCWDFGVEEAALTLVAAGRLRWYPPIGRFQILDSHSMNFRPLGYTEDLALYSLKTVASKCNARALVRSNYS